MARTTVSIDHISELFKYFERKQEYYLKKVVKQVLKPQFDKILDEVAEEVVSKLPIDMIIEQLPTEEFKVKFRRKL